MNDKKQITNRMLGLCGVALLLCWVLKLWGGVVFDFVVTNQTMVDICYFIENSVVQYIIYWVFYMLSNYLCLGILSSKKSYGKRNTIIFVIIWTIMFSFNFFSPTIKTILDFIVFPLIAILVYKTKWWKAILWMLCIVLTQIVLMQIRNGDYTLYSYNFIAGFLMQIDYYIVLIVLFIRRTL